MLETRKYMVIFYPSPYLSIYLRVGHVDKTFYVSEKVLRTRYVIS